MNIRKENKSHEDVDLNTKKFILRMPDELHAKLVESSKSNRRSINAEIIKRLEASFEILLGDPLSSIERKMDTLITAVNKINKNRG